MAGPGREQITGLVLAGGRGTRMGGLDKGLIDFRGRTLIASVLERLQPQVGAILISANRNLDAYRAFGWPVVADAADCPHHHLAGPLAGMLAGLRAARTPWLAVVPCDAPLLPADLVARLAAAAAPGGAAMACVDGKAEPVFCLLSTVLAAQLAAALTAGERRTGVWLRDVGAATVAFAGDGFANLNTPAELQATMDGERSLEQALAELTALLAPVDGVETIDLDAAAGRVLAAEIPSAVDLPPFDNSAMDGYALRTDDMRTGHRLREIGHAHAGHAFVGRVETGTCVRIMTGAPIPDGADTVAVLEDAQVDGGTVRIARPPPPGANIRRRGEHIARGERALPAGRLLRAADIGLAAAVGAARVDVRRRLRVGVVSTGDELADPPQPLRAAESYDANRPLLRASLLRAGFDAHDLGICRDKPDAFAATLARARALRLDALLSSGGAALGDADIVRSAGGVRFVPLAVRPGRGLAFARLEEGGAPLTLFGLPGNAVAAFIVFYLLARPLLLHLAGAAAALPAHLPMPLAGPARVRAGRIDYRRARFIAAADGTLRVQPLPAQGSAMLRTVTEADALVALGPREQYEEGDTVPVVPLATLDG